MEAKFMTDIFDKLKIIRQQRQKDLKIVKQFNIDILTPKQFLQLLGIIEP